MDDAHGPAALDALIERTPPPPLPRARPAPPRRLIKLGYLDGDDRGGALGLVWLGLLLAGAVLGPTWLMRGPRWLGAATCVAVAIAVAAFSRRGQAIARDREARLAGALGTTAFPCEGLIDWLTADRPLADLHLRAAIEPTLVDAAIRAIDAGATTRWLTPTTVRVALSPRLLRAARGRAPALYGGDLARLRALLDQVVAPLVATPGVARLDLGGEVDADASGPA